MVAVIPGLAAALDNARARLLAQRGDDGCWRGELASSALATAVAVCALSRIAPQRDHAAAARGRAWLAAHANADGGWGDTPDSPSNLPTTLLAWAALGGSAAAEAWIAARAGGTAPAAIARAVAAEYGDDLTFTAPLLALLATCGRLGPEPDCWRLVAQLPVELAVLPRRLWPHLRLGVVSYGLPALIAVGVLRHRRLPGPLAGLREVLAPRALRVLARMWPDGAPEAGRPVGGYNEAPPLVGFVGLGLAGAGLADHPVAQRCAAYLRGWQRVDGAWSVEADLRSWLTALAVAALSADGRTLPEAERTRAWLAAAQRRHCDPTTGAAPGGWAWNDLPGAMPDGDDTSGALLALHALGWSDFRGAAAGARWLLRVQNADGGIPTFCRGWSGLAFDRSCPDLTAHALRAWTAWQPALPADLAARCQRAAVRATGFLRRAQRSDGAWEPLWFGNQAAPRLANPVYGTAQVVSALAGRDDAAARRGQDWLAGAQGADGGWGGERSVAPSLEETALATAALAGTPQHDAARRGAGWLIARSASGTVFPAAPIGLYFAKLWYGERLYPLVWTVLALTRVQAAERSLASAPPVP